MNEAQVIVTGNLANKPSLGTTPAGASVANMRLGYTPRRYDRESGQWVDGQTSWVTVKCWRKLADNVAMCLNKGDPVMVKGALQVRPYTDKDGNPRLGVEILASAVGHDLNRGVTHFFRMGRKSGSGPVGAHGEAGAGGFGQPDGDAADGEAGPLKDGQPGDLRAVGGLPWDPAREGAARDAARDAAEDADADMFDESAVVAAALHAVPDLDDATGDEPGDEQGASSPAGEGTGSGAAAQQPSAQKPTAQAPTAQKPTAQKETAEKPVARKPAAERPAADKPASDKPAADKPASDRPASDKPADRNHRRDETTADARGHRSGPGAGDSPDDRRGAADPAPPKEPSLT
jgi:single-strand DNA-binding protein